MARCRIQIVYAIVLASIVLSIKGQCRDLWSYCPSYIAMCHDDARVKEYCRVTCGLCGEPRAQCSDLRNDCYLYPDRCNEDYFIRNCAFTCGVCGRPTTTSTTSTTTTTTTTPRAQCSDRRTDCYLYQDRCNGDYFIRNCALTCGVCGGPTTPSTTSTTTTTTTTTPGGVVTCAVGFCGDDCSEECRCHDTQPPRNGRCAYGRCARGVRGYPDCQDIDCGVDNGGCDQKCFSGRRSNWCGCWDGYILQADGKSCVEDDKRCLRNTRGSEYSGTVNTNRNQISCSLWTSHNVTRYNHNYCRNPPGVNKYYEPWCYVIVGSYIYESMCGIPRCSGLDACHVSNCQHDCDLVDEAAQCNCFPGYWDRQGACIDIDECASDTHQCSSTEQCVNTEGGYYCDCRDGFMFDEDAYQCQDIDECSDFTLHGVSDTCHRCINTVGGYTCECNHGYESSSTDRSCYNINECSDKERYNVSDSCHYCRDTVGSYYCLCRNGYSQSQDIKSCIDIDECADRRTYGVYESCHTCINTVGSYHCDCDNGYESSPSGKRCYNIDECSDEERYNVSNSCHYCRDTDGSYYCDCGFGYTRSQDRKSCLDIDECADRSKYAVHDSCHTCINTVGSYRCDCDDGYESSTSGKRCYNVDECAQRDVYNVSASCHECVELEGSYRCNCQSGYIQTENEKDCVDVNECDEPAALNESCHVCQNTVGSYYCDCHDGYEPSADQRACNDKDECSDRDRNNVDESCHTCVNTDGLYYCTCDVGYRSHATGRYCDACESGRFGLNCSGECHCLDNASCDRVDGTCPDGQCGAGWTGHNCQQGCPDGTFGPNCRHQCECGSICNKVSGACQSLRGGDEDDDSSITPILASVISILVVAGIIVILLILSRRYLQSKANRNSRIARLSMRIWNQEAPKDNNVEDTPMIETATCVAPSVEKSENEPDLQAPANEQAIYGNVQSLPENTWIAADCLEKHVASFEEDLGVVQNEHMALPSEKEYTRSLGQNPEVAKKNRFKNIQPYDYNIVSLSLGSGGSQGYINASWVPGYKEKYKYIASQGPTKQTVNDFWSMIWEHNVSVIAMLTNLFENNKRKCECYWPDTGQKTHDGVTVTFDEQDSFPLLVVRRFTVSHSSNPEHSRPVTQFHFTSWPDHGVPNQCTALIRFCKKVSAARVEDAPTLVHCSAGVGRTGTFIALDWLLQQAEEEGGVDVPSCVNKLRDYRMNMVQNADQYIFLYRAVSEGINLARSSIPCHLLEETYRKKRKEKSVDGSMSQISKEFMMLSKQLVKADENDFKTAKLPENASLNRSEIIPKDGSRVRLMVPVKGRTDYINAVFVKGYRVQSGFIATQWPMDNTMVDFWRMVTDYRISSVVVLQTQMDTEITPSKENRIMNFPHASVHYQGHSKKPHLSQKTISVEAASKKDKSDKSSAESCTIPIDNLLETRRVIKTWQDEKKSTSPILIVCSDGATCCGWYIAACIMLDMMAHEGELDLFYIVRQLKLIRKEFIPTQEMYESLFTLANEYQRSLASDEHTYGNL